MNVERSKKKKPLANIILIVIILVIIGGCMGVTYIKYKQFTSYVVNNSKAKGATQKNIEVVIENGSSIKTIAKILKNSGVIDSELQFLYLCKENGLGTTFQPGTYVFNNYMDFNDIVDILHSGRVNEEYTVFTIKEGQTIKDIAGNLESAGIVSADEFISACNSKNYDFDFVKEIPERDNLLEGYLFPDTYYFTKDAKCDEIINKALSRFEEVFNDELILNASNMGRSVDDIVIIASIIEAEVKFAKERPTVASVIYNRLNIGMKLQMDATVLYALGEKKDRVLYSDLEIQDGHNTYFVDGLPIGPIGNPGASCIEAAINPDDTDYLYYVLKDPNSGEHTFSSNAADFQRDKDNYINQLN